MTQEPRPNLDTTPTSIGLPRLPAALTAWDTGSGSSAAMPGAGTVGGGGAGSGQARASRGGMALAGTSEIPPSGALT